MLVSPNILGKKLKWSRRESKIALSARRLFSSAFSLAVVLDMIGHTTWPVAQSNEGQRVT